MVLQHSLLGDSKEYFKYFFKELYIEKMFDPKRFLMKKKFWLAVLVVALVGVTVTWGLKTATYSEVSPLYSQGKLVAEATQCPFEFTITLEKNAYKLGEPINIMVTLKNVGEESVTITFLDRPNPSPYSFWGVYNESQQLVFYHKYMLTLPALEEITLQPGEFMQSKHTWNQKATDSGEQVAPGIYYLTAVTSFIYNEEEVNLQTQSETLIEV